MDTPTHEHARQPTTPTNNGEGGNLFALYTYLKAQIHHQGLALPPAACPPQNWYFYRKYHPPKQYPYAKDPRPRRCPPTPQLLLPYSASSRHHRQNCVPTTSAENPSSPRQGDRPQSTPSAWSDPPSASSRAAIMGRRDSQNRRRFAQKAKINAPPPPPSRKTTAADCPQHQQSPDRRRKCLMSPRVCSPAGQSSVKTLHAYADNAAGRQSTKRATVVLFSHEDTSASILATATAIAIIANARGAQHRIPPGVADNPAQEHHGVGGRAGAGRIRGGGQVLPRPRLGLLRGAGAAPPHAVPGKPGIDRQTLRGRTYEGTGQKCSGESKNVNGRRCVLCSARIEARPVWRVGFCHPREQQGSYDSVPAGEEHKIGIFLRES